MSLFDVLHPRCFACDREYCCHTNCIANNDGELPERVTWMAKEQHAEKLEDFLDSDGRRKLTCISRQRIPEPAEDGLMPEPYAERMRNYSTKLASASTILKEDPPSACECGCTDFLETSMPGTVFALDTIYTVIVVDYRCVWCIILRLEQMAISSVGIPSTYV